MLGDNPTTADEDAAAAAGNDDGGGGAAVGCWCWTVSRSESLMIISPDKAFQFHYPVQ